ncbi:hypothetical protein SDRG_14533 [Saprolegnia diclina VS20]|uniref:Uncharacterized protein n=1 Tax=Saprolegnia diclina (strain VS20) TaxID=1156394 RepID=T0Q2R3_SAPDV|nr:hypothetical protein SDRG_14533 [Saprolegnia diclina VS20]EQC27695.1 hypothetical protein SDRG_14533 [Saprolegnia diclina VS20]|eukprot:XP_008618890.1 hypothetical protein SDRG_14533 [Saprolegnia diclina VS20]
MAINPPVSMLHDTETTSSVVAWRTDDDYVEKDDVAVASAKRRRLLAVVAGLVLVAIGVTTTLLVTSGANDASASSNVVTTAPTPAPTATTNNTESIVSAVGALPLTIEPLNSSYAVESTNVNATASPTPRTETPAPTTKTPAPTTETPAPTTETPAPTTVTPAPTTSTPAPTTVTPKPTTTTPPAAPGVPKNAIRVQNNCGMAVELMYILRVGAKHTIYYEPISKDGYYDVLGSRYDGGTLRIGRSESATLFEFGHGEGKHWYDISVVPPGCDSGHHSWKECMDYNHGRTGYNVPMKVEVQSYTNHDTFRCRNVECRHEQCDEGYQFPGDNLKCMDCAHDESFLVTVC